MWSNIGHKIKTLAKVICWIGIVLSVISAYFIACTLTAEYVFFGSGI